MRRPSLLATAGARCSRTLTSRTVRSPTFFTEPVTVTNGSLVVVTVDGVTLSMGSSRNSGSSSTVWVPALSGGTGSWAARHHGAGGSQNDRECGQRHGTDPTQSHPHPASGPFWSFRSGAVGVVVILEIKSPAISASFRSSA